MVHQGVYDNLLNPGTYRSGPQWCPYEKLRDIIDWYIQYHAALIEIEHHHNSIRGMTESLNHFLVRYPGPIGELPKTSRSDKHYSEGSNYQAKVKGESFKNPFTEKANESTKRDERGFLGRSKDDLLGSRRSTPTNSPLNKKMNESEENIIILANQDMKYNVLVIGTRKDKDAINNWNGIEIPKTNDQSDVVGFDEFTSY
jgi:hypothetical protein